jgi:hypothetical protein
MGYRTVGEIVNPAPAEPTPSPVEQAQESLEQAIRGLPRDLVVPKRGNRDRAFARADEKAKELVWTQGGSFYVVETEREFAILDEASYNALLASAGGSDILGQLASAMPYQRPKAEQTDQGDIKAGLIGPRNIDIDDLKYRDAVVDIHYNNGSIDDLSDDLFAAAMFDEDLSYSGDELMLPDGSPVTFESIMDGTYKVSDGIQIENRRFRIVQMKSDALQDDELGGLWRVYKFTDKETGAIWYLKASTYGANDAMMEDIGMRAGQLLDLAAQPDSRHIRISPNVKVTRVGERNIRWTAMRNVDAWGDGKGKNLSWLDSHNAGGIDSRTVNLTDLGQILAMDFILDNTDRHGGNIMVAIDDDGSQRLGIIDNGLLMGGRVYDGLGDWGDDATPEQIRALAMKRANMSIDDVLKNSQENYLLLDQAVMNAYNRIGDVDGEGEQFSEGVNQALERIKENLDSLLDPDNFEKRGIPLTATEKAHLNALKTVASMRIEMLESYPDMLSDAIGMRQGR